MAKRTSKREVLVPGSLLPDPQPGRFHGVVTCVKPNEETGLQTATIALSDEKIKLQIPWQEAQHFLVQPPGGPAKKRNKAGAAAGRGKPPLPVKRPASRAGPFDASSGASSGTEADVGRLTPEGEAGDNGEMPTEPAGEKELPPPDPSRYGNTLQARLAEMAQAASARWPQGTKLWLRMRGYSPWPVVVWSSKLCLKKDTEQLLATYKPGLLLVRFHGEHSSMWVKEGDLDEFSADDSVRIHALRAWGRQNNKSKLVEAVMEEVEGAIDDIDGEVERMLGIEQQSQAQAHSSECSQCQEEGATAGCAECERIFHTLCMLPPALRLRDLPDRCWNCPFCGHANQVGGDCNEDVELKAERMGLTPDWIIQAAAFGVFQLEEPTPERPYIKGLLDPCTNSMAAPNIPAEILYDKQMNGLKLSNSWKGFHILLNPDYKAAVQWRFVNRAIDEVENDQVPAVLLVCRNSTDTAYFQRLRPYPRVLLRRANVQFKDFDKSPIGFGICVFAIAKSSCRDLYSRFYEAFASQGEPNIAIDKTIMQSHAFGELLDRLRLHAEEHLRDHWIQCSICTKWRIITYEAMLAAKDDDWTCRQLRAPFTSCRTPQTKREILGGRYAVLGADGEPDSQPPDTRVDYHVPRLDLLSKPAAESNAAAQSGIQDEAGNPDGGSQGDTPLSGVLQNASLRPSLDTLACSATLSRLTRLPARPLAARASQEVPQVMTAIELARQARIAANRAFLAGLRMDTESAVVGAMAMLPGGDPLVIAAAKQLAEKAALAEAREQVEKAKRYHEKTMRGCQLEEQRLRAALETNAKDREAADEYLRDARAALAALKAEHDGKLLQQEDPMMDAEPGSPCPATTARSASCSEDGSATPREAQDTPCAPAEPPDAPSGGAETSAVSFSSIIGLLHQAAAAAQREKQGAGGGGWPPPQGAWQSAEMHVGVLAGAGAAPGVRSGMGGGILPTLQGVWQDVGANGGAARQSGAVPGMVGLAAGRGCDTLPQGAWESARVAPRVFVSLPGVASVGEGRGCMSSGHGAQQGAAVGARVVRQPSAAHGTASVAEGCQSFFLPGQMQSHPAAGNGAVSSGGGPGLHPLVSRAPDIVRPRAAFAAESEADGARRFFIPGGSWVTPAGGGRMPDGGGRALHSAFSVADSIREMHAAAGYESSSSRHASVISAPSVRESAITSARGATPSTIQGASIALSAAVNPTVQVNSGALALSGSPAWSVAQPSQQSQHMPARPPVWATITSGAAGAYLGGGTVTREQAQGATYPPC